MLAYITYAANWCKPKDILPAQEDDESDSDKEPESSSTSCSSEACESTDGDKLEDCTAHNYYGASLLGRTISLTSNISSSARIRSRISNDSVRLLGINRDIATYYLFAYSSFLYRLLHSLSMFSRFPTMTEHRVIMIMTFIALKLVLLTYLLRLNVEWMQQHNLKTVTKASRDNYMGSSTEQSYVLVNVDMPDDAIVYKYGLVYAISNNPSPVVSLPPFHPLEPLLNSLPRAGHHEVSARVHTRRLPAFLLENCQEQR
jgi:hypothetical protein